jgi:hypothetical protein
VQKKRLLLLENTLNNCIGTFLTEAARTMVAVSQPLAIAGKFQAESLSLTTLTPIDKLKN